MEDMKKRFATHLASIGFDFDGGREAVLTKLKEQMGEERYLRAFPTEQRSASALNQEEFYQHFDNLIEASLMRSLDTTSTMDSSYDLFKRCASSLCEGSRVLELGCWTGGLASFIAALHPECQVVGADMSRRVIDSCTAHYQLPNLKFVRWNYRFGKPEDLEPADVLLCAMGVVHHLPINTHLMDPCDIRGSEEYRVQRGHALGYFGLWRSAARPGAKLFAVLRLKLYPRFLAWIDAAQMTGWKPRLERTWRTSLDGETTIIPGLLFEAEPAEPLAEEVVFDAWARFAHGVEVFARLHSASALASFRSLAATKKVLAKREFRHAGRLTGDEVGFAAGVGYAFTYDAVDNFRLLLVSTHRAEQLASGVRSDGLALPITDAGVFEGASENASKSQAACFGKSEIGASAGTDRAPDAFSIRGPR